MSSRYGWSSRPGLSPFNSTLADGAIPAVTDDDYSYITSEDLENHTAQGRGLEPSHQHGRHSRSADSYSHTGPGASAYDQYEKPEDDVMLIKYRGVIYPEHFPAYSIGDGQLFVNDVVERVRFLLQIPERDANRIRLLYKGRHLTTSEAPVRDYGVKNNSELLVVISDRTPDSNSESSEEIVVVGRDGREDRDAPRKPRKKKKGKNANDRSPRDSGSSLGLEVPVAEERRRAASRVRTQSPSSGSRRSPVNAPAVVPGGPIDKLNTVSSHFNTKLLPLCLQFTMNPPSDLKKREDEHRKISETVMQQVLLKLDEIDTAGDEGARAQRKALVRQVQDVLKGLDEKVKK